jgi:hypothetical protein
MPEVTIEAPQISSEEYEKYRGKNVAIYKNKIIAVRVKGQVLFYQICKIFANR